MIKLRKRPGLHKLNRRGSSTMFLAIILSALILIECLYLAISVDIDRRYAVRRGIKLQTDAILADYDRELFRCYGIYAFDIKGVDDSVFCNTLETQGISSHGMLNINGYSAFTYDEMRRAISVFYAYRTSGILTDNILTFFSDADSEILNADLEESVREFTSSKAADYLRKLLNGGKTVTSILGSIGRLFDIDSLSRKMDDYKNLISGINAMLDEDPDYTGDFDIGSLAGFADIAGNLYDLNMSAADITDDYLFRTASSHYGAYNFDTALEGDSCINGTLFDDLHAGNYADAEYILTGLEGDRAVDRTKLMIFPAVYGIELTGVLRDSEKMAIIEGIAEVMSAAISLLSVGTVVLPSSVYKAVIVALYSGVLAYQDMKDLMDGGRIDIIPLGDYASLSLGYRDFIFIYLHFLGREKVLDRMADVLSRDYEGYCSAVTITAGYDQTSYSQYATYQLYE